MPQLDSRNVSSTAMRHPADLDLTDGLSATLHDDDFSGPHRRGGLAWRRIRRYRLVGAACCIRPCAFAHVQNRSTFSPGWTARATPTEISGDLCTAERLVVIPSIWVEDEAGVLAAGPASSAARGRQRAAAVRHPRGQHLCQGDHRQHRSAGGHSPHTGTQPSVSWPPASSSHSICGGSSPGKTMKL